MKHNNTKKYKFCNIYQNFADLELIVVKNCCKILRYLKLKPLTKGYIKKELTNPITPPKTKTPSFTPSLNPFQIPTYRDLIDIFCFTVFCIFLHFYAIIIQNVVKLCSKIILLQGVCRG